MREKYRIIIDTNFIWQDSGPLDRLINLHPKEILDFIKENKLDTEVSMCIPDVVIKERITQQLEEVSRATTSIDTNFKKLTVFNIKKTNVHKKPYRKLLKQKILKELKLLGIEIIPMPNIKHEVVLQRVFNRIKPFSKSDKGYKDTLIWLSLLDIAKKDKTSHIILCTNNTQDFDLELLKPEFNNVSNKEIFIFPTPQEVKEFFDKTFGLSLDLKAVHQSVIEEIKRNSLGDIMAFIHSNMNDQSNSLLRRGYVTGITGGSSAMFGSNDEEIVGYAFKNIVATNISGNDSIYTVEADIVVEPKHKGDDSSDIFRYQRPIFLLEKTKLIPLTLKYDLKKKEIDIKKRHSFLYDW